MRFGVLYNVSTRWYRPSEGTIVGTVFVLSGVRSDVWSDKFLTCWISRTQSRTEPRVYTFVCPDEGQTLDTTFSCQSNQTAAGLKVL